MPARLTLPTAAIFGCLTALAAAGCGGASNAAQTINDTTAASVPASSGSSGNSGVTSPQKTVTVTVPARTATAARPTGTVDRSSAVSGGGAITPTSGGACTAQSLSISFLGSQGATGHGELGFAVRNGGTASCHTFGYPGVAFLDASGNAVSTQPVHATTDFFGTSPLARVNLAPGATASFRLGLDHVSSSACVTVDAVSVIPPDDTQALRVSIPGGTTECGGRVTVSPMRTGTSAYP